MKFDFDVDKGEDFLKTRVESMGLDRRTTQSFLKNKIRTIGGIVRRSEKELKAVLGKDRNQLPQIFDRIGAIAAQTNVEYHEYQPSPVSETKTPEPVQPHLSVEEDDDIIATLSEFFGYEKAAIEAHSRRKEVVQVRDVIIYLLRQYGDMSYPAIGRLLGGRDHTTVIHAFRKMEAKVAAHPEMEDGLSALIEKVSSIKLRKEKAEEEVKEILANVDLYHPQYKPQPHFKEIPERSQKVLELYREGLTYQNIGSVFGVSRERVRQLVLGTIQQIAVNESVTKGIVMDSGVLAEEESKKRQSAKDSKKPEKKLKEKRWSRYYAACRSCGTTAIPHVRNGLCENCSGQLSPERRDQIIQEHGNKCDSCGMSRGEAMRTYGRDLHILKLQRVLCRKCFLQTMGTKLGTRPRKQAAAK